MNKAFLTIRLQSNIKKEIERIAKDERRSVSQVGLILLELGLKIRNQEQNAAAKRMPTQ